MITCRDCKHWMCPHPEWLENYSRETPPKEGWMDGVCKTLQHGITIEASGGWEGATVDSVETDANFGCIYAEAK
jgi:hypothetical protein